MYNNVYGNIVCGAEGNHCRLGYLGVPLPQGTTLVEAGSLLPGQYLGKDNVMSPQPILQTTEGVCAWVLKKELVVHGNIHCKCLRILRSSE